MSKTAEVVLFDLWMTLIYSLPRDPILDLQVLLGLSGSVLDPKIAAACLTTDIGDEKAFLRDLAAKQGLKFGPAKWRKIGAGFAALTAAERDGVRLYPDTLQVLTELKRRGKRLGLISNLWPFPVDHIFKKLGLGAHFEHLVYSFAEGVAKPDRRIFQSAMERFAVAADRCLMVGDSLSSDIGGASGVLMPAVLINRTGKEIVLPTSTVSLRQVTSLSELLQVC